MAQFDLEKQALVGASGFLAVRADDEITGKLSMLIEGECEGWDPLKPRGSSASASNATFSCERPLLNWVPRHFEVRDVAQRLITDERPKLFAR